MGGDEEAILVHKLKAREKNDLTKMEPLQSNSKRIPSLATWPNKGLSSTINTPSKWIGSPNSRSISPTLLQKMVHNEITPKQRIIVNNPRNLKSFMVQVHY